MLAVLCSLYWLFKSVLLYVALPYWFYTRVI